MQKTKADIRRAAYLTVHEFPPTAGLSAVESAALVIGRAPGTTYNKVDPASEQGLYLTEALQLMLAHGDHRILHALAAACDHVAVPHASLRAPSDTALLDLFILAIQATSARATVLPPDPRARRTHHAQ